MILSHFTHRFSLALTALAVMVGTAWTRGEDIPAVESREQEIATGAALTKVKDLQAQIEELKLKARNLSETLAQSNVENAQQKEDYARMRLKMEALGVAALNGDERSLQTRLLDAVSDFRLSQKANQALTAQLVQISEAAIAYMKSSDAESRHRLETALAAANLQLKQASEAKQAPATPLGEAKVVSFKSDLGLAVVNAGKQSGLRLGMPVHFVRKDHPVAKGVIVDCRDQITGILITTSESGTDSVVLGDVLTLEPTQPSAQ